MLQHDLLYALLGFTGKIFVAHDDRFDLAEGLPLIDESERQQLRRILRLGFWYSRLEVFITARLFGLQYSPDMPADVAPPPPTPGGSGSPYQLALASGLEEALQPYRARVLELEEQLQRAPSLALAEIQLGFTEWELSLPALVKLLGTVPLPPQFLLSPLRAAAAHSLAHRRAPSSPLAARQVQAEQLSGAGLLDFLHDVALGSAQALRPHVQQLLAQAQQVFLAHLSAWLLYGELLPEDEEFFVRRSEEQPEADQVTAAGPEGEEEEQEEETQAEGIRAEAASRLDRYGAWWSFSMQVPCKPQLLSLRTAEACLFVGKVVHLLRPVAEEETVGVGERERGIGLTWEDVIGMTEMWEGGPPPTPAAPRDDDGAAKRSVAAEAEAEAGEVKPAAAAEKEEVKEEKEETAARQLQRRLSGLARDLHRLQAALPLDAAGARQLERALDAMHRDASALLWRHLTKEHGLRATLKALKDYFLLGRGEIWHALVEELRPHLGAPPAKHLDLQAALQLAASGVETDAFLPRLRLCLPAGAAGAPSAYEAWRGLSLRLEVSGPLRLLLHPRSIQQYNELFGFLWVVKRVQIELQKAWASQTTIGAMPHAQRAALMPLWRLRAHMSFLVDNLQYYLQVDVLDVQWLQLTRVAEEKAGCEGGVELGLTLIRLAAEIHPPRPHPSRTSRRTSRVWWRRTRRASPRCTPSASCRRRPAPVPVPAFRVRGLNEKPGWLPPPPFSHHPTQAADSISCCDPCHPGQVGAVSSALHQIFQLCLSLCRMLTYAEAGARAEAAYRAQLATLQREFARQSAFLFAFLSNMSSPQAAHPATCSRPH